MRKLDLLTVLMVFILATMACQISAGVKPPRNLSISPSEAKSLENSISNAKVNLLTGVITLQVTESQVTSYVTYNMPENLAKILSNPQIFFEPNQILVYGTYMGDMVQVDGRIVMTVTVTSNQPRFTIVSAEFGPIPMPEALKQSLTEQLDKEVIKALSKNTSDYQLSNITSQQGLLTINLKKK